MTDQPDPSKPTEGPWAIPHDLDHFSPTPSDIKGLSVVQFFLGWFDADLPNGEPIARTKQDDYTLRRLVHSYEKIQDVFYQAAKEGGEFEDMFYADVLSHAIYLAEGLTFLALKFKAELEDNDEPWKNGGPVI